MNEILSKRRQLLGASLAAGLFSGLPAGAAETVTSGQARRLTVVLGGGSARGFAHIGVIKALETAGLRPDRIVGCSAGSL